jgi:hypothetical protein
MADLLFIISRESEARKFEHSQLRLVLAEMGLQGVERDVCDAHLALTGEQGLSFLALDQVFPGFPILFVATSMYGLVNRVECSQTSLFRDYQRYLPCQQYESIREMVEDKARGRPVGMLYRWQGVKYGLILHDGDFPLRDFAQVFPWGERRLTAQHFRRFLKTLVADHRTPESLRVPLVTVVPENKPWQPPRPWELASLVTDKAEFRLLALLLDILYHMPPEQSRKYVVRYDGQRWIAAPQEWLAEILGCSVRTLQRAAAGLKRNGLIESRHDPGSAGQIRVCPEGFQQ